MKKIFNYILLLCLIVIPCTVNAHELSAGDATKELGTTTIPIYVIAGSDLTSGQSVNLDCDGNGVACSVSFAGIDGVSSEGRTLYKDVKSGDKTQIAKITLTNNTFSEITVSAKVSGMGTNLTIQTSVKGKQALKTDSKFSALSSSQGKMYPAFSANESSYTIYGLKDTVVTIYLNFTCDKCTISGENAGDVGLNPGSTQIKVSNLQKGENSFTLISKSEDGANTSTYNFNVIRGETAYDSAKLSSLSFGDYVLSPVFKKSVYEYELEVPYSVKDLTNEISANPEDSEADIEIEGLSSLVVGENTITIKIKSVNKDEEATYTIKVKRLTSEDIIVQKYKNNKITFLDAEGDEQKLSVDEFKTTYPNVWKDIESGKIKFDKDGNVIAEEAEEKEEKKSNKKTIVVIVILVVAVTIIGLAGYFLFRKKDPEKEKKKEEEKIKKKVEKKKRKEELKKLEAKYYNEDYDDEDEDEEDEEESNEITEDDKLSKAESESLLDDDYIFESTLIADEMEDDEEDEEEKKPRRGRNEVIDVDSALEDLMNTKTYDFSDELKNIDDEDEEDE